MLVERGMDAEEAKTRDFSMMEQTSILPRT